MSNPLYDQFGRVNTDDIMNRFRQFQQTFKGDPRQMIQNMLNSGQITQEQFNRASQMANEMMRFMK